MKSKESKINEQIFVKFVKEIYSHAENHYLTNNDGCYEYLLNKIEEYKSNYPEDFKYNDYDIIIDKVKKLILFSFEDLFEKKCVTTIESARRMFNILYKSNATNFGNLPTVIIDYTDEIMVNDSNELTTKQIHHINENLELMTDYLGELVDIEAVYAFEEKFKNFSIESLKNNYIPANEYSAFMCIKFINDTIDKYDYTKEFKDFENNKILKTNLNVIDSYFENIFHLMDIDINI